MEFFMEMYTKKGYLNSEFRLFHLTDRETHEIAYHYHDFDKITIFIKGNVSYMIEGKSYALKPYDIVLVRHGDIHRLSVDNSVLYERIIVYISPNFMDAYHTDSYDLSFCFRKADKLSGKHSQHSGYNGRESAVESFGIESAIAIEKSSRH